MVFGLGRDRVETPCFGLLAEFEDSDGLLKAVNASKDGGYRKMEAYTPLPLHEVAEALGYRNFLPAIVFVGGVVGALTGWALQYYASVESYPMNVGGRPDNSWPSFVIVIFELTILFAAGAAVLGMLALNGLPRPHHPCFDVPEFAAASRDRFFLLILAHDPRFDLERTAGFLGDLEPLSLSEVPNP